MLEVGMSLAYLYFFKDIKLLEGVQRYATKVISGMQELLYAGKIEVKSPLTRLQK